jgi:hypothetical protein
VLSHLQSNRKAGLQHDMQEPKVYYYALSMIGRWLLRTAGCRETLHHIKMPVYIWSIKYR